MTVRRAGISGETRPTRKSLGRVLVTVDDLEALRQQLQGGDSARSISFEFPGGDFTDAEELKKLSDDELRHIDVKTSEVQVTLYHTRAVAIGPPNAVESIYEQWARIRQTKRKPDGWRKFVLGNCVVVAVFCSFAIGGYYFQTDKFWPTKLTTTDDFLNLFVPLFLVIFIIASIISRSRSILKSYAIVMPMSIEQLRSQDFEANRTKKTILATIGVGIIGALVTIITLIARKWGS